MTTAPKNNSPDNYSKDTAISEFTALLKSGHELVADIKKHTSLEKAKKKYETWIANVSAILKKHYQDNYFINLFKDDCTASVNSELDNSVDICTAIESGMEFLEDRIRFLNLYGNYPGLIHLESLCKKMVSNLMEVFPKDILADIFEIENKKSDNEWKKKYKKIADEGKSLEVADPERKDELLINPRHLIIKIDPFYSRSLGFNNYNIFIDEINDHKSWFEKEFIKCMSIPLLNFLPEWNDPIPKYDHGDSIKSFNNLSSYVVDLIFWVDDLRNRIVQERQKAEPTKAKINRPEEETYSEIDKQLKGIEKKFFNVLPENTFIEIGNEETILFEAEKLQKKGVSIEKLLKMPIDEICKGDKSVRYINRSIDFPISFAKFGIIHDEIHSIWAELDVVKEGCFHWVADYKSLALCDYRPEDHKQIYQRNVSDEDLRHLSNDVTQGIKTVRVFLIYSQQKTVRPELFKPLKDESPTSREINFNKNDIHYTHVEQPRIILNKTNVNIVGGISQSGQKKEDIADLKDELPIVTIEQDSKADVKSDGRIDENIVKNIKTSPQKVKSWKDVALIIKPDLVNIAILIKDNKVAEGHYTILGFPKGAIRAERSKLWDLFLTIARYGQSDYSSGKTIPSRNRNPQEVFDPEAKTHVDISVSGDDRANKGPNECKSEPIPPKERKKSLLSNVSKVRKFLRGYFKLEGDPIRTYDSYVKLAYRLNFTVKFE